MIIVAAIIIITLIIILAIVINYLVIHDCVYKHCHAVFGQNLVLRVHICWYENNDGWLIMININNVLLDFAFIKHPLK